jgi:hypothetical protein
VVDGGSSLGNISKGLLGFSQHTSCVLVHGYSSCDVGLLNYVIANHQKFNTTMQQYHIQKLQ